ncbi:hypothetical protein, partial [Mycobacteroides abscessus]|uniref:hypothetical protein n=1 Tax=Mycobacteroides abscessus TaxID=36809 RepID=UPI001A988D76
GRTAVMNSPNDTTWWSAHVRSELDELGVPQQIQSEISLTDAQPSLGPSRCLYPPRPGYTSAELGTIRFWGAFDLPRWFDLAPEIFGPYDANEIRALSEIADRLKQSEPDVKTYWALDILRPGEWVNHPRIGFAVSDLVCFGPRLPEETLEEATTAFARYYWGLFSEPGNTPCTVDGVGAFETTWAYGV